MPELVEPWSDCGYGDGSGDFPSEMSVTLESAPGEGAGLRVKNEVNLLPGEEGFRASNDLIELTESMRRGGGLSPGFSPIPFCISVGLGSSLGFAKCCCDSAVGGTGKSSNETLLGVPTGLAEK